MITIEQAREMVKESGETVQTTMREWFQENHLKKVHTIQCEGGRYWKPLFRVVDATRATYVTLDGSRRDYAGWRVEVATSRTLLVSNRKTGDWIAYILAE